MVYCAAMMKEDGPKGGVAGYLVVEITALYLKNLEEIFKVPSTSLPLVKSVYRDQGAVFLGPLVWKGIGRKGMDLLESIPDVKVVPDLPGELLKAMSAERRRGAFQCIVEALPPRHGRKLFSWRAVPAGLSGFEDAPGFRSEPAVLDKGAIHSLSEMIGTLLGGIR